MIKCRHHVILFSSAMIFARDFVTFAYGVNIDVSICYDFEFICQ